MTEKITDVRVQFDSTIEISPIVAPEVFKPGEPSPIRFIDLRNSPVDYNFAFFNSRADKFVTMCGHMAWNSFIALAGDIRSDCRDVSCDSGPVIRGYTNACPEWVF